MVAKWHNWVDGGAYLQVMGGIKIEVCRTDRGQYTFLMCEIPMPPSFVYDDLETAKTEAVKALRQHLQLALEKL